VWLVARSATLAPVCVQFFQSRFPADGGSALVTMMSPPFAQPIERPPKQLRQAMQGAPVRDCDDLLVLNLARRRHPARQMRQMAAARAQPDGVDGRAAFCVTVYRAPHPATGQAASTTATAMLDGVEFMAVGEDKWQVGTDAVALNERQHQAPGLDR
jgi:hypothetical protein